MRVWRLSVCCWILPRAVIWDEPATAFGPQILLLNCSWTCHSKHDRFFEFSQFTRGHAYKLYKLWGRPRPCKLTKIDLLTLKVVSESRVTWATSAPLLVLLGLLGPMYATDRRQTISNSESNSCPQIKYTDAKWNCLPRYRHQKVNG